MRDDELVLVTGGTGFVGVHCVVQLLDAGYRVRTTLRSSSRADEVREMVRVGGADPVHLEFVEADLLHDDGWHAAAAGARYVLHVASPFPVRQPKNANELIRPAREGTLRVLGAARDAGVRRVVLTSSFAAIGYGRPDPGRPRPYTEEDWTDLSAPRLPPYTRSKTIAERAAWDFIGQVERDRGDLELAVVNPVPIFGPALGRELSTSVELLLGLLNGHVPAVPNGSTTGVDVRDVADLHVRAMTHPDAAGERFLAISGDPITFPDLAKLLRERLGPDAKRVPTRVLPDWLVRVGALVSTELRAVAPQLRRRQGASSAKAERMLGWRPRPLDEAVVASAESLVRLGLVRP
ncbi:SDR family oxidoreductase [Agromyces albus]|uniref:Aldehyde reductase n=1 Tax=Agromyces albus TaxID=205332 RepID=A0A4Q2KQB8_9MICO|nr:aldehyde reductase [Agromyces albus]RXZ67584.1 aldehyde reductase [Agromyces albus]